MLCRCSFAEWGGEHVAVSFAYNGGLYLVYKCPQPIATQITQDARPKIVDALLTLICRIAQEASLCLFDCTGG